MDAFYWMIIPHVIIKYENAYQQNKTNASSPNRIYQHINHHCNFSCCFIKNIIDTVDTSTKSASFLTFSQGLLGVFPWFSHVFHPILAWCFLPYLHLFHFSHGFPMVFPILPSSPSAGFLRKVAIISWGRYVPWPVVQNLLAAGTQVKPQLEEREAQLEDGGDGCAMATIIAISYNIFIYMFIYIYIYIYL